MEESTEVTSDDRQLAAVAYAAGGITPLLPLVIWLTAKKDFIKVHGKRAFVAHLLISIAVTCFVLVTCGLGVPAILLPIGWGIYEATKVMKEA